MRETNKEMIVISNLITDRFYSINDCDADDVTAELNVLNLSSDVIDVELMIKDDTVYVTVDNDGCNLTSITDKQIYIIGDVRDDNTVNINVNKAPQTAKQMYYLMQQITDNINSTLTEFEQDPVTSDDYCYDDYCCYLDMLSTYRDNNHLLFNITSDDYNNQIDIINERGESIGTDK